MRPVISVLSRGVPLLFLTALFSGCGSGGSRSRGTLTTLTPLAVLSVQDIAAIETEAGIPVPAPKFGVKLYKLDYETDDLSGQNTTASGLLAIPDGNSASYPVVSYDHGTEVLRSEVPSNPHDDEAVAIWAVFGGAGYIVAAPDYLGLGDSEGMHPYLHAATEASASVDMLRAAQAASSSLGIGWEKLFVTGYSQGAHAALALLRDLGANEAGEFSVALAAPGDGPYDLSGTMVPATLAGSGSFASYSAAYLALAYNSIYKLTDAPDQLFVAPFDSTIPPLFDGFHAEEQIFQALPSSPRELLTSSFIAAATDPSTPAGQAIQQNDVYNFLPEAPVRLFHSTQDDVAPFQNSVVAEAAMAHLGADVAIIPLTGTHAEAFGQYVVGLRELLDSAVQSQKS